MKPLASLSAHANSALEASHRATLQKVEFETQAQQAQGSSDYFTSLIDSLKQQIEVSQRRLDGYKTSIKQMRQSFKIGSTFYSQANFNEEKRRASEERKYLDALKDKKGFYEDQLKLSDYNKTQADLGASASQAEVDRHQQTYDGFSSGSGYPSQFPTDTLVTPAATYPSRPTLNPGVAEVGHAFAGEAVGRMTRWGAPAYAAAVGGDMMAGLAGAAAYNTPVGAAASIATGIMSPSDTDASSELSPYDPRIRQKAEREAKMWARMFPDPPVDPLAGRFDERAVHTYPVIEQRRAPQDQRELNGRW